MQALRAQGHDQQVIRQVHAKGLMRHYKALKQAAELAEAQAATRNQAAAAEAFPHLYAAPGQTGTQTATPVAHGISIYQWQQLVLAQQLQLSAYALQQQMQSPHGQQQSVPSMTGPQAAAARYRAKKARSEAKAKASSINMAQVLITVVCLPVVCGCNYVTV